MSIVEKFETMEYGPAPEDPKEALLWLDSHKRRFGVFIDGEFREPASKKYEFTTDPSTGDPICEVALAAPEDIHAAVAAAKAASPAWKALSGHERARYLYAIARHVQKHSRRLAVLETMDNGKPIRESRDIDVPLVARHFYYHAGWAQLLEREFPDHEACGVVGQIIPWNFPILMMAWKIAPALAAGNTVVLKPAQYTPLTALAFAEICAEVGLPKGVVNIVTGSGSKLGTPLLEHPDVDKVAFTGSTEVGRTIRKQTANSHKKLSLELGGKSPFVIFEDCDLDSAVEGLVDGIWFNQGQVCCAGSRALIQESIAEPLIQKLRARMENLRVGPPLDKAIDIGAIVSKVQLDRIQELVDIGCKEGAECWQPSYALPEKGYFFKPTVLTNVHPASVVAQEEIFGPVLAAMTFRTPAEAVELANNTIYGLASSVWSESINVALHVAAQIKAGVVWVNCTNMFDAACGFGGYRESGYGREGGREGMLEYLEPKWFKRAPQLKPATNPKQSDNAHRDGEHGIDRTVKLYIGGKQARPDGGYSVDVLNRDGEVLGEAPLGNRKDIRNAVEAARKAQASWGRTTAHNKAQILFYMAENMIQRRDELVARLAKAVGKKQAAQEVDLGIQRLFTYAGYADKYDGLVHNPPYRMVSIAMNEPVGVMGIVCPQDAPLLGFLSLIMPAVAMGNAVVAVPSQEYPLIIGDLYQIFETSDLPGGVINMVCGRSTDLLKTLAEHDDVDSIWCFLDEKQAVNTKLMSLSNLKQVFTNEGRDIDWFDPKQGEGRFYLEHATQVKNIWTPYGE